MDLFPDAEYSQQGNDSADGVGEAGGELVDSEQFHRKHLHPDEQRRFFPERLVVDLHVQVVFCHDHFPGDLGEVDLVPVEQGYMAQEREEEEGAAQDYGEVGEEIIFIVNDQNTAVYFNVKIVK
jgi:hypothetical protein